MAEGVGLETAAEEKSSPEEPASAGPTVGGRDETTRTIWCVRHAQSEYNATVRTVSTWMTPSFWSNGFDPRIRDPRLSQTGWQQVHRLRQQLHAVHFMDKYHIDTVLVSPLRRAIDTALGSFGQFATDQMPHLLTPPKICKISTPMPKTKPKDSIEAAAASSSDEKVDSSTMGAVIDSILVIDSESMKTTGCKWFVANNLLREWMDTLGDVGTVTSELRAEPLYSGGFQPKYNLPLDDTVSAAEEAKETTETSTVTEEITMDGSVKVDFSEIASDVWWLPTEKSTHFERSAASDHICPKSGGIIAKESKADIRARIEQFKEWLVYDYCKRGTDVTDIGTESDSGVDISGHKRCENVVIVGHSRWLREFVGAKSKLPNCGVMKVTMRGTDVISHSVVNFDSDEF